MYDMEKFKKFTEQLRDEFDQHSGDISCNFSTSAEKLAEKMEFLAKMECKSGYWTVGWCPTCAGYDELHPFHCELIKHP